MRRRAGGLATLVIAAMAAAPSQAEGQVSVGIGAGLSIASLDIEDGGDDTPEQSRVGLLAGGFVNVPLNDVLSFTTGLYYAQKGARAEDDIDVTVKLDYLEIPLLVQFAVARTESAGVSVFLGPSVAFEVGCELEGDDGSDTQTLACDEPFLGGDDLFETKGVDFGALFGAGARFMASESMFIFGNGGLDLGLTSIDDSAEEEDIKNSMWFVQAGIGWVLGG